MITISNYDQQKNSIDWKSMPKNIQDNRNDVESIMEFYNDDADIKDTVNLFFKGINANSKPVGEIIVGKLPKSPAKGRNPERAKVDNLTEFKNWLSNNIGVKLYLESDYSGPFPKKLKEERTIEKVQSEKFATKRPNGELAWMDFDVAKKWTFSNRGALYRDTNVILIFHYEKPDDFTSKKTKETLQDAFLDAPLVRSLMPKLQQMAVLENDESEEVQFFIDKVKELEAVFVDAKKIDMETPIMDKIVKAHYFYGSTDWFIFDYDPKDNVFFGYVVLNGDTQMSEAGYISVEELMTVKRVELDFFWDQVPLGKALHDKYPSEFDEYKPTTKKVDNVKPAPVKKVAPKKEKVKEVVNKKYVDNFTEEFKLIRRFWNIIEDVKITIEFRKAQLLYMAFNKAAVERKVRKESSAADIFTECNKKMKVLFEEFMLPTQSDVKVDFTDKALYEQIKDYVSNVTINPGVAVLKRYIAIQNTLPDVKKVQTLLKALERVQVNFKDNRLASEVDSAIQSLKNYLEKPKEPVEVIQYALSKPRVCTNRIKCVGVDKNGKLHKGYKFQEHTGYVVKTKRKPVVVKKPKPAAKKKSHGLKKSLVVNPQKKAIKKGLKNPIANVIANVVTASILGEPEPIEVKPISSNPNVKKIGTANNNKNQFFTVAGEVGKFLQQVERKPVESVVITMDGQQGAGKTTTLYKFMDAFATPGNKCIFISGEEHPESHLAIDKANKLLSSTAKQNIDIIGDVKSLEDLYKTIAPYEIVFIDSWQKLQRMVGLIRLDEDLRKKFNGKVFVVIFQQTTTGRTKGGAEVVFDGDIIIKMVKEASFEDNYAYFDKNRYTLIPIENIRYNIANGKSYNPNAKEVEVINVPPVQNHQFTFRVS